MAQRKNAAKEIDALAKLFRLMEADYPEERARSQIEEGIPQLHRFVFLRTIWKHLLTYPPEVRGPLTEFARSLCGVLDGPPAWAWVPPQLGEINWGLFVRDDDSSDRLLSGDLDR